MAKKIIGIKRQNNRESGYTLLEYCAGAAVITVTLWAALTAMGDQISGFLTAIGSWAQTRATEVGGAQNQ